MDSKKLNITVVEDDRALEAFIRLPWKIYEGNPYWIPPLLKSQRELFSVRNPFLRHAEMRLFLARLNGQSVGRIAAIIDYEFVRIYQERIGYFGFFECIPDYEVAEALLSTVERFLKGKGIERIRGPLNPSMHDEIGLLIDGYDLCPSVLMAYNPPYYVSFVEKHGFRKAKDFFAFTLDLRRPLSSAQFDVLSQVKESGITLRPMNARKFYDEVELLRRLYNTTFMESHHWGFVPITAEEAITKADSFKAFLSPNLIWFAEASGQPVGFFFNLPDINPILKKLNGKLGLLGFFRFFRRVKRVHSLIIGVLGNYGGKGIGSALLASAIAAMQKKGYKDLEWSPLVENNIASVRLITKFGGRKYKEYRIYEKDL